LNVQPVSQTVPALVELRASQAPNALAVVDGKLSLTYGELEARSSALSSYIASMGLGRDAVVGLCAERSIAQVVGALAIMKAGAAFLPLDPALPSERLRSALRDAGATVALTAGDLQVEAALAEVQRVHLHGDGSFAGEAPAALAESSAFSANLAYVIYTSGSTGEPKGVEITHAGLSNLVAWHQSAFHVTPLDRASHLAAVGFDAAVWEVWPYLTAGASVYIADNEVARDPQALADWLIAQGITIAFVSTPMAERLLDLDYPAHTALRVMLTGADVLHRYPPASLPFELHNNYGPTETTVVATSGRVLPATGDERGLPSIGRAIDNMQVYILDDQGVPQGNGIEGEICVAGAGLARGYRGRPDMTAERFPSLDLESGTPIRVYRTGDRGRRHEDGSIEFLGRVDDQVKLRGFRIELREIEVAVNSHFDVLESAAVLQTFGAGAEELVVYVVKKPGRVLTRAAIQDHLSTRLPAYMVPNRFIELPTLPLTANGKVDRKRLQVIETGTHLPAEVYVGPRTEVEEQLAQIVSALLKLDRVSVDGDFFKLGGHSLLGTQLIARVRDAFSVNVKLRFLFEFPTVAALAAEVERQRLAQRELVPERAS